MNPQKFWKMVEKDPWLLWVTHVGRQLRCNDFLKDPSLLGSMLSPSHIKTEIAYIAFRPWEKLDLNFKNKEASAEVKEEGTSELRDAWIDAAIYWHEASKEDVLGIAFFSQVLNLADGQTIREALDSLEASSKVDAVVLTGTMDVRKGKNSEDLIERLLDPNFSEENMESYDIYRPSSVAVVER